MTAHPPPRTPPLARAEWDRAAAERSLEGLLDAARADDATRVLVIRGDSAPLSVASAPDAPLLHFARPGDVSRDAEWAFLGRDEDGAALLAAVFAEDAAEPFAAPGGWIGLRSVGGRLEPGAAGLFVEALALGRWLLEAPHCPACGARTEVHQAGWARRCPACGREHFPRTDPAVIVAVESSEGDRLLLGSNALWGQNRYSCFAGFVEAGESLEAAVAREVEEECGIRVRSTTYRGSQSWPYPRSLMLGFRAQATDDDDARADGEEIVQVRWFTRAQIGEALEGESEVALPGTASIAYTLIRDWYDGR